MRTGFDDLPSFLEEDFFINFGSYASVIEITTIFKVVTKIDWNYYECYD